MGKSSKMLYFTRFFAVFRLLEVPLQQALLVLTSSISLASGQVQKLVHFAARPLQIKPTSLGFDLVWSYLKYLSSKPFNALPWRASSRAIGCDYIIHGSQKKVQ